MYFSQEVQAGVEATTTDSGVGSLPGNGNEESQTPQEKAPVRFGWMLGVMVLLLYI